MERIAALVEGQTEDHFVKETYGNVVVRRPFPNGEDVPIDLISESIVESLELLGSEIKKVVILLDREKRLASCESIKLELMTILSQQVTSRTIYIGLSDRNIECWALADEAWMRQRFQNVNYRYRGDGSNGKVVLRELAGMALGPRDTAILLKNASPERISQSSPSFRSFRDGVDFPWKWLKT